MFQAVPPTPIFVAVDGEVQGPFAAAELSQLWRAGDLDSGALYWHRGLDGWRRVESFANPQGGAKVDPIQVRMTTAHGIAGRSIQEELGIVSAEYVFAQDLFGDWMVQLRDLAGGRSRTLQDTLRAAKTQCMKDLREEAASLGGDGVIGVHLSYAAFGTANVMLVATGTAVGLGPPRLP